MDLESLIREYFERVTTGRKKDVGRGAFFRFLPATSTHRYALTTNLFSVCASLQESPASLSWGSSFSASFP